MKIYLVLFCLVVTTSAHNIDKSQLTHPRFLNPDAIMRQVLEMLRLLIKNGSPDIVPIMDPLEFEHRSIEISVPNKLLTISGNFTNGILKGLGDFEVLDAAFIKNDIAVYFSINFPLLRLTSEKYQMKGNVYEAIPLAGRGSFEFQINNFKLWSKIYLKQSESGQSVVIDRIHGTGFSITNILSRTEFDNNIDEIFNALIEDLLADYLTLFGKLLILQYQDSLVEYVNPFLEQFESWRFIAAIL